MLPPALKVHTNDPSCKHTKGTGNSCMLLNAAARQCRLCHVLRNTSHLCTYEYNCKYNVYKKILALETNTTYASQDQVMGE